MMETTYLLVGQTATRGNTMGTAFVLLRPFTQQPQPDHGAGRLVLVTAAHVLEGMAGDSAVIHLRTVDNRTGTWTKAPARLAIRRNGQPLWKSLPGTDVAAMYIRWPLRMERSVDTGAFAPTTLLIDDDGLKKANVVGPGVDLKVLGYPLGNTSNDSGFPILRTGVIASYPLLPTLATRSFLLDFRVFKGNSGGPVYLSQPQVHGSGFVCCPPQFLMGLVSEEATFNEPYSELQLELGKIVNAGVVKSVIDSLPPPESTESEGAAAPIDLIPVQ